MATNVSWQGSPLGRLWIIAMALAGTVCAQDSPTFRTGVFLMHVDAEVLGPNGRPLTGLTKDDFRILDGGAEQDIVAFSEGEQPLDLIVLFDISSSMRRQVMNVAAVAGEGLRQLRPGDRVSVMVFGRKAQAVSPFSSDPLVTEQAINRVLKVRVRGGTFIQDAVREAAQRLIGFDDRNHLRRAVLVITDNFGAPPRDKMAAIESLWESDALVGGLVVDHNPVFQRLFAGEQRRGGVENLVEQTGGDMIRSDDLTTSFPEMMHRIRTRYTLYYKLPEGEVGTLRKIDVQLSAQGCQRFPGAHVVARRAYRLHDRDQYGFVNR